jgi:hypothetical protein
VTNLKLKLDRDLADEHLLSLIYYETCVINPGKPFGPGWFLRDLGGLTGTHRESMWRQFRRLEKKGYIRFSGSKRPPKGKSMTACEITEIGIAHAGLRKLEDIFGDEDEKGSNLIIQGILGIHRALKLLHSVKS